MTVGINYDIMLLYSYGPKRRTGDLCISNDRGEPVQFRAGFIC